MRAARGLVVILSTLFATLPGCKQENAFQPPPPPTVTVAVPLRQSVVTFAEYTGRVAAVQEVDVRARVRGFLQEVAYAEGENVAEGDLLYQIEPEQYEAILKAAMAREQEAEAEAVRAQFEFERVSRLYEAGTAAQSEFVDARAAAERAKAEVLAAEAAVTQADLDLSYTTIRAPISGRVNESIVDMGNLVGPNEASLLTTIVPWDPVDVYFTISERDVLEFRRRQAATYEDPGDLNVYIRLADGTDYPEIGQINYADNRLDPETGTMQVRAQFANPEELIVPGLFARVRIPRDAANAILVPEAALQRDVAGFFLMVVDGDGIAQRRDVSPGERIDRYRVIDEGLTGDERVIIKGLQRVRPGSEVNTETATLAPIEFNGPAAAETPASESPASAPAEEA